MDGSVVLAQGGQVVAGVGVPGPSGGAHRDPAVRRAGEPALNVTDLVTVVGLGRFSLADNHSDRPGSLVRPWVCSDCASCLVSGLSASSVDKPLPGGQPRHRVWIAVASER
jgi:hypothetical protein